MVLCKANSKNASGPEFRGCRIGHGFFNLIFAALYGYSLYFFNTTPHFPTPKPQGQIGGHAKYLTSWDLYVQFAVSVLSVLVAVTNCSKIRAFRDSLHHGIAFPFGLIVATIFWGLYAVNPELIFPKAIQPFFPQIHNHITHTLVAITPIFNELTYFMDRKGCALHLNLSFGVSYMTVLLYFAFALDYWIYPVFEFLTPLQRGLFLASIFVVQLIYHGLGSLIHCIRWGGSCKKASQRSASIKKTN